MRLAVWCNFHCDPDLGKCSAVNMMYDLCDWFHKNKPGFHTYFYGPKQVTTSVTQLVLPKRFHEHPGITVLPYAQEKFYKFRGHPSNEALDVLHPEKTQVPYDLILTRDTYTAAWWKFALLRRSGAWFLPIDMPIVTMLQESIDEAGIPQSMDISGKAHELAAFLATDKILTASKCETQLMHEMCRKYLAPSQVSKVMDKTETVPNPVNYDRIRERFDDYQKARQFRRDRNDRLVVFHGGTFEAKRQLPQVCRGLDALGKECNNFTFLMSSQTTTALECKKVRTELRDHQDRDQYYDNLKDGDICLWPSLRQTAGVGYLEAAMSGMIPIVIDAPWVLERIPRDYPYVMKNIETELPLMLIHIKRNWKTAQEHAARFRECLKPWGTDEVGEVYYKILYDLAEKNRQKCAEELFKGVGGKYVKSAIDCISSKFEGTEMLEDLATSHAAMDSVILRKFTPLALRWMLLASGFKDVGGLKVPHFEKETS